MNHQIDLAIKEKYQQVYNMASIYQQQPTTTTTITITKNNNREEADDIVQMVKDKQESLCRMRVQLPAKRELLNKLVTRFVKVKIFLF